MAPRRHAARQPRCAPASESPERCRCSAYNMVRVFSTACSRSAPALAALAGVLAAPIRGVDPFMGVEALSVAFVVVVVGGMGNFAGRAGRRTAGRHRAERDEHAVAGGRPPDDLSSPWPAVAGCCARTDCSENRVNSKTLAARSAPRSLRTARSFTIGSSCSRHSSSASCRSPCVPARSPPKCWCSRSPRSAATCCSGTQGCFPSDRASSSASAATAQGSC